MKLFSLPQWLSLLLLPLALVGCTSGMGEEDRGRQPMVTVQVQGQYTRKVLTANGFTSLETRPTRHAYAEVLRSRDLAYLGDTVLDANGRGLVDVPQGEKVFAVVYAQVAVPDSQGGFAFQGSVKGIKRSDGSIPERRQVYPGGLNEFNNIPNWYLDSPDAVAGSGTVLAMSSAVDETPSGAFNIADQMVTLAQGMRRVAPTLPLPNLHAWWSPKTTTWSYPKIAEYQDGSNIYVLTQRSGRYVFQFDVPQTQVLVDHRDHAFNDSALQAHMTRLLFADFSDQAVKPDASGYVPSVLRRDNDNVTISRGIATESTAAFVAGMSDFLSCAFRNSQTMYDLYTNPAELRAFDLRVRNPYNLTTWTGEFYRENVCLSLHGIWKNALGGGDAGLQTLWTAMRSGGASMGYVQAPLGCYPTFLFSLKNVGGVNWNGVLTELALERIGDVTTTAYFNSPSLWLLTTVPNPNITGSLRTYLEKEGIYYDRDQSQAYRFTQSWPGNRSFTLEPTGGQDFFVELIGSGGVIAGSYDSRLAGQTRSFSVSSLPQGDYVVRVRAGYTTANAQAGFRLRID